MRKPTLLNDNQQRLLADLLREQFEDESDVNARRFRAEHSEHLSTLDEMVQIGWIEERDRHYLVTLIGVAELAPDNEEADAIIQLCNSVFDRLREEYLREPEQGFLVENLEGVLGIPLEQIHLVLPFLRQASLFRSYTTDLTSEGANVVLAEELILHKSFDEITAARLQRVASRVDSASPRGLAQDGGVFRTPLESYTRIKQIGQGGSGLVISARNEDGNEVAIKYLDPEFKRRSQYKRFRNEIRFGQRVTHPNVLRILDVGVVEVDQQPTLFYVMPLYPMTLRTALQRSIAPTKIMEIFDRILEGVEAAHAEGVWHRDLKPENILLNEDMSEVRVADFGIAHFSEEEIYSAAETRAADRLANFRYAAPEQRDRRLAKDQRADIFALGLILNEMFTGEVPQGTGYRKISADFPDLGYLDDAVAKMIRQRADQRPSSISEVREVLRKEGSPAESRTTFPSSTVFFSRRFSEAFPGVRGIQVFDDPSVALQRLSILLRDPLTENGKTPFWWWRSGDMPIEHFTVASDNMILLDGQELIVDWIAALNPQSYYQQFVYIQTRPAQPSGLYDYSYVENCINESGFAREEFAIYEGNAISRAEYDDGATVVDGTPVRFSYPPDLRVRYLSSYNLLIAPQSSPINNTQFDRTRDQLLNQILHEEADLEDLASAVLKLPKRDPNI